MATPNFTNPRAKEIAVEAGNHGELCAEMIEHPVDFCFDNEQEYVEEVNRLATVAASYANCAIEHEEQVNPYRDLNYDLAQLKAKGE